MRLSSIFAIAGTFAAAAVICLIGARFAVVAIEENTRHAVRNTLDLQGMTWTEVDADGLQVFLAGTAPTEATRFKALSVAGTVVDAARVIDQMLVEDTAALAPPRFSIEILRNDATVSLIGLAPAAMDREGFVAEVAKAAGDGTVSDFLELADYPAPAGWDGAVGYAVRSLRHLERTKISVDASRVEVTATAESLEDKVRIESELNRRVPEDIRIALDISAPRPVITPFTLRFLIEKGDARFDACSADTEAARQQILGAANAAGLRGGAECTLGLGVPSPHWADAASLAISAVAELGGGVVTFSDADISLLAVLGTPQGQFDDVVGRLETSLPEVFALHAVLPEPPDDTTPDTPEFVATLSPEGLIQLRGRLDSEQSRDLVDSFAKARFTSDTVHTTARVVEGLPNGWTMRVLTALEALSYLSNGAIMVTPDTLDVSGATGRKDASAMISGFLSDKLGEGSQFSIDVSYLEVLDPVASQPTLDECEDGIVAIQAVRKISFEPGSPNMDASGAGIMDDIAELLKTCGEIRMEIGGHTDSQGREVMNQQLSQARANTVLSELRMRRVLTASISANGYGESQPIADNGTEAGREANRRIEFRVIRPETTAEAETTLESLAEQAEKEATGTGQEQEESPNEQN